MYSWSSVALCPPTTYMYLISQPWTCIKITLPLVKWSVPAFPATRDSTLAFWFVYGDLWSEKIHAPLLWCLLAQQLSVLMDTSCRFKHVCTKVLMDVDITFCLSMTRLSFWPVIKCCDDHDWKMCKTWLFGRVGFMPASTPTKHSVVSSLREVGFMISNVTVSHKNAEILITYFNKKKCIT